MFELIFACAIGITCPEAKTFKTLDDCDRGRNSYSSIIAPGKVIATCRQRQALPPLRGTTNGWIAPKKPEAIKLYRVKFIMASTDRIYPPSTWYDKNTFSLGACRHYAEQTIHSFMTSPQHTKKSDSVASMSYKCEPFPDDT